ncbi:DUF2000 domain-containing protein [Roseococcus sp. SYP-B2431]|nr:DUF2000 domain-containing protein [Roseococcus sp. SYP-B2431]
MPPPYRLDLTHDAATGVEALRARFRLALRGPRKDVDKATKGPSLHP